MGVKVKKVKRSRCWMKRQKTKFTHKGEITEEMIYQKDCTENYISFQRNWNGFFGSLNCIFR